MKNKTYSKFFLLFFYIFINIELQANETKTINIIEKKISEISSNIRCLVCRNQSIYDSNSDFAKDIKKIIKNKLKNGENNKKIYDYLQSRYGDYILFKPPLQTNTILLWFLPFVFIVLGIMIMLLKYVKFKRK